MSEDFMDELEMAKDPGGLGDCGCKRGGGGVEFDPFADLGLSTAESDLGGDFLDIFDDLEGSGADDLLLLEGDHSLDLLDRGDDLLELGDGASDEELELFELGEEGEGPGLTLEDVLALAQRHPGLRISFGF